MSPEPHDSIEVFYSYAHEDEKLRDELKKHLSNLKRQGVITDWYDRDITAGSEWDDEIKQHLESARVILLLISPDFMNSDYINDVEVKRAMERHEAGEARVIPVILRPVDWEGTAFSKLQALPTDVKPVRSWDDPDEAFLDITKGIRKAILELSGPSASVPTVPDIPRPPKVGFVSRRDKDGRDIVERLREELAPERNQLVALWGAGGVGKTTLAAEAVRAVTETHGQRVIWISADGRPSFAFSTLLDDIAEQLGRTDLRRLAVGHKEEALRRLISDKPTVIVLDNLETITPEEETLCKEFLAKRVPCPALITTRERIDDALLIPLAAMAPDEAEDFLKRLIRQSPDPDIYNVVNLAQIHQTAEFNPLIIQWIVGQIDLAQDPAEVLTDLAQGEGDAAHRVFDRSYNLPQLNEGGRAVLLALALFTPSAGRPALAAVAGMDLSKNRDKKRFKKAQETLASLWLITKMNAGLRLAVAGLTRELTKVRLDTDLRGKAFRLRFVTRFLRFAETHAHPSSDDYNALESEKDNLITATKVAFNHTDRRNVLRFANALALPEDGVLSVRGYWDEAFQIGTLALKSARSEQLEAGTDVWLHNIANLHQRRGEFAEARPLYDESLRISRKRNDQTGVAKTLHNLAVIAHDQGELEQALDFYYEALEIEKHVDDQNGIARTLHQLAQLSQQRGDLDESNRLYEESWRIARNLGDQGSIASNLLALGTLAQERGEMSQARHFYKESLEIANKLGDKRRIASNLHQLGLLSFAEKDNDSAERLLQESLVILRGLDDKMNLSECLESIGELRVKQGLLVEARSFAEEALQIAETIRLPFRIASVKHFLALLTKKQGDTKGAIKLLYDALAIFEKLRSPKANNVRQDLEQTERESSQVP